MTAGTPADVRPAQASPGYIEHWYLAYGLLGITVVGGIPILFPLTVIRHGTAGEVGLVIAALNLGSIVSPVWGALADRYRLHRVLLTAGMVLTGGAMGAFAFASTFGAWALFALLAGLGSSAASTVAYMFIVEAHPKAEWAVRVGWLQTIYGVGWVVGLLLAGVTGHVDARAGLLICGALTLLGAIPGWAATHTPPRGSIGRPQMPQTASHVEQNPASLLRNFHVSSLVPRLATARYLGRALASPFGVFLGTWMIADAGGPAYLTVYPVLMQRTFEMGPVRSSFGYAAAVAISLFLYAPAGRWANRLGAARLLRLGFAIRLLVLLILAALAYTHPPGRGLLAELWFAVLVCTWTLLGTSAAAVAARRCPLGEGEGVSIYMAATAVACVVGAAIGGWSADLWGYAAVPVVSAALIAIGLCINLADAKAGGMPHLSLRSRRTAP